MVPARYGPGLPIGGATRSAVGLDRRCRRPVPVSAVHVCAFRFHCRPSFKAAVEFHAERSPRGATVLEWVARNRCDRCLSHRQSRQTDQRQARDCGCLDATAVTSSITDSTRGPGALRCQLPVQRVHEDPARGDQVTATKPLATVRLTSRVQRLVCAHVVDPQLPLSRRAHKIRAAALARVDISGDDAAYGTLRIVGDATRRA